MVSEGSRMIEPYPIWTPLGAISKVVIFRRNFLSILYYIRRFTPDKLHPLLPFILVPCQCTHPATRRLHAAFKENILNKAAYQLVEIKYHCQYCSKTSNEDRGPHWCVGSVTYVGKPSEEETVKGHGVEKSRR